MQLKMMQNNFQTTIRNIALFGEKLSLPTYIISAILIISTFSISAYFGMELYLLLGIIGSAFLWIMLHYPKVWIYCVVAGCALFFDKDDEGISAIDIFVAAFFNVFLIIWFVTKLLVKSEKKVIINESHSTLKINKLSEKLFLLFYFLLPFNFIIAVLNGVDITDWIREYMFFILILYYFPIRDYFNDKRSIIILLLLFAVVAVVIDVKQFYIFYKSIKNVMYAYEIGHTALKINQQAFSAVIFMGITLFIYSKNKLGKLLAYSIVVMTTFALILTFSRAFWASVMALTAMFIIYIKPRQILQLLMVMIFTTGLLFATLDIFFPKQSKFVQKYIIKKFETTTQGRADPSVEARLREYKVVLQEITESPLYGQGFRKKFSFYSNVSGYNWITSFIHNGYLNLIHKTGIPMAVLFYFTIVLFNIRGYIVAWKLKKYCIKNRLNKKNQYYFFTAIAIGASLTITMLFITNIVTSSFFFRDGLIVTTFSLAFISIAERKYNTLMEQQN
jgi:hypothetical protein